MNESTKPQPAIKRGARGVLVAMIVAVAGTVALSAWADRGPAHAGMGGPMPGGLFAGSPERVSRAVDHFLDGLNATDAQRTQIKQIAQAAAVDLKAQFDSSRQLHEQGMQIFTAPTVDANAAESVRQQLQAQHDQTSRRTLQAMLDISRVLTPEQRVQIAEQMKQRHAKMKERMQRERPAR